jgi:hypothetical protein
MFSVSWLFKFGVVNVNTKNIGMDLLQSNKSLPFTIYKNEKGIPCTVSSILSWDINSFIRFIHSKEKFVRIVG